MKSYSVIAVLIISTVAFMYCTKSDQVVGADTSPSTSQLNAFKTSTPPVIDGTIDAVWSNATKLSITPTVPDPGNGLFAGYIGNQYPATLRSMYDGQYVYFLAEWNDPSNYRVQPWYFDSTAKRWAQRSNSDKYDVNGVLLKKGMGQDQFAFQWNVNNSTANFATQTCYASCHIFTPYRDYTGKMQANASGNHYTNAANEKVDLWWCHLNKDLVNNQMDDWYIDWAGGPSVTDTVGGSGNGRHADDLTPPTPFSTTYINNNTNPSNGPFNNSQSLKLDGTGASVSVPKWVMPGAVNKLYYLATDTLASGSALKVVGVSSAGVLTLINGTTLDPMADYANYADNAGTDPTVGAKCFPAFISAPLTMGRADITATAIYTGTGWVLEMKRLLKTTTDIYNQDVDFTSLQDQPFGVAIFNTANNQHAIQPNLLLHFQ